MASIPGMQNYRDQANFGQMTAGERATRSVFVGNIPYEATEEQLKDIFSQVGPVMSFRLVYDRETGKPKGYGFCEYQDTETAQSAMRNLNNHDFNGRPLRVGVAAGEQSNIEKGMQQALGGPPIESPFGDPEEPEKAPEAISKAVASLPPEQMFELMKQMKLCIQNNPNEARNMLLQNPQLAYALLQAQIVMKIVDPQVALAMLHRQTEQIPPLVPNEGAAADNKPVDSDMRNQLGQGPGPQAGAGVGGPVRPQGMMGGPQPSTDTGPPRGQGMGGMTTSIGGQPMGGLPPNSMSGGPRMGGPQSMGSQMGGPPMGGPGIGGPMGGQTSMGGPMGAQTTMGAPMGGPMGGPVSMGGAMGGPSASMGGHPSSMGGPHMGGPHMGGMPAASMGGGAQTMMSTSNMPLRPVRPEQFGPGGPGAPRPSLLGTGPRAALLGDHPTAPGQRMGGPPPQDADFRDRGPGPRPEMRGGPGPGPMGPGRGPQDFGPGPGRGGPDDMGGDPRGPGMRMDTRDPRSKPNPNMGGPPMRGQGPPGGPMGTGGPMGGGPGPMGSGPGPMGGGPAPMGGGPGPMGGGPGPMGGGAGGPMGGAGGPMGGAGGPMGGAGGPLGGAGGPLGGVGPGGVPNAGQDQEKAALIMQVLQLSDEQIAMLPPDQRQSILILKEQISRSHPGGGM